MRRFCYLIMLLTGCATTPSDIHSAVDKLCEGASAATPEVLKLLPPAEAKVLADLHNACAERDLLLNKSADGGTSDAAHASP